MRNKDLPEGIQDISYLRQYAYIKSAKKPRKQKTYYKPDKRNIRRYNSFGKYEMGEDTKEKIKQRLKIARVTSRTTCCNSNNRLCK